MPRDSAQAAASGNSRCRRCRRRVMRGSVGNGRLGYRLSHAAAHLVGLDAVIAFSRPARPVRSTQAGGAHRAAQSPHPDDQAQPRQRVSAYRAGGLWRCGVPRQAPSGPPSQTPTRGCKKSVKRFHKQPSGRFPAPSPARRLLAAVRAVLHKN